MLGRARKEAIRALAIRAGALIRQDRTDGALNISTSDIGNTRRFSATFGYREMVGQPGRKGRREISRIEAATMSRVDSSDGTTFRIEIPTIPIKQDAPQITAEIKLRGEKVDVSSREIVPAGLSWFSIRFMAAEVIRRTNSGRSIALAQEALNILEAQQAIARRKGEIN